MAQASTPERQSLPGVDRRASWQSASGDSPASGEDRDAFLKRVRLFRVLPPSERSAIAQELELQEYAKGEAIVRQGEHAESMFIVWTGRAVACFGTKGHEMKTEVSYESGDWFGEMALMHRDLTRAATILCDSDVKVFRLSLASFKKMRSASRSALRILGFVRYSSAAKRQGAYLLVLAQLGIRLLCAALFWPVVAVWVYHGRASVAALSGVVALEPRLELAAFLVMSGIVAWALCALLPIIRIGIECVAQILCMSDLPAWQVAFVEKLAAPLMRSCALGVWCLVLKVLLNHLHSELELVFPGFTASAPAVSNVAERVGASAEQLWITMSLTMLAGYLLDVKNPPTHIVDGRPSAPGTWAYTVEQYYLALQNPRAFKDEYFADIAAVVHHLLTGVIILLGTLPWFRLLGIHPAQVMTLGSVGTIAFSFASKEVLENLVSGMLLQISKPFMVGDNLMTEDAKYKGVVRRVGLSYCELGTDDGETLMVPNSVMLKKSTVSKTRRRFRVVRASFPVVLEDLSRLGALCEQLRACVARHPDVISGEAVAEMKRHDPRLRIYEPQCVFTGYGPHGASIDVHAWTPNIRDPRFMQVSSEILLAVNEQIAQFGGAIGLAAFHLAKPSTEAHVDVQDASLEPVDD